MEAPASINFNAGYKSLDLKLIDVSVQIEGILPLTFIKHILRWAGNMSKQQRLQDDKKQGNVELEKVVPLKKWLICLLTSECCLWGGGMMVDGSLEEKETRKSLTFLCLSSRSLEAALHQTGVFYNTWSSNRITVKCMQVHKKDEGALVYFSFKVGWNILAHNMLSTMPCVLCDESVPFFQWFVWSWRSTSACVISQDNILLCWWKTRKLF